MGAFSFKTNEPTIEILSRISCTYLSEYNSLLSFIKDMPDESLSLELDKIKSKAYNLVNYLLRGWLKNSNDSKKINPNHLLQVCWSLALCNYVNFRYDIKTMSILVNYLHEI